MMKSGLEFNIKQKYILSILNYCINIFWKIFLAFFPFFYKILLEKGR